jgi:hypothetical protein
MAPVEEPQVAPEPEIHSIPLMAPAPAPVEEPVVELPAMAPPEPEVAPELVPAAVVEAQPVELAPIAPIAPEPASEPAPVELTVIQPEPAPESAPVELTVIQPEPAAQPVEPALPAVEPLVAAEADIAPATELEELFAPKRTDFQVVVRLKEGDGVTVGSFRDFGTAMEGAQEVIEQFSTASEGQWPFYAGRFIRPDLIVSVDVVEGDGTES